MKNYLMNADFEVYEDNYTEGQQGYVNGYSINGVQIWAENPMEAVAKFYENTLYLPFDKEGVYIPHRESEEGDKNVLQYSNLVDEDNTKSNQTQLDLWKKRRSNTLYFGCLHKGLQNNTSGILKANIIAQKLMQTLLLKILISKV